MGEVIAYASSVDWRKNHLCSAAQYRSALEKNRADFDIPLVAKADYDRLVEAMHEAIDLLLERKHGNPARSSSHNARVTLQFALTGSVATDTARAESLPLSTEVERNDD